MNWPVTFLHVVGREDVCYSGKLVEQAVLETEHGCRSNYRGLWEDVACNLFASSLGAKLAHDKDTCMILLICLCSEEF
jgi:hypothetical protein